MFQGSIKYSEAVRWTFGSWASLGSASPCCCSYGKKAGSSLLTTTSSASISYGVKNISFGDLHIFEYGNLIFFTFFIDDLKPKEGINQKEILYNTSLAC